MVADLSREELLHEVLVAPRSALVPLPDTVVVERPGWFQLLTPSLTRGGLNEVTCTHLPDGLAGERLIDETIASYRSRGIRFRWTVWPDGEPADLGERLARRGLAPSSSLVMARATSGAPATEHPLITVEEVTPATADEYTRAMADGWGVDPGPFAALTRRTLADPARRHHLFLARHDGAPAAAASQVLLDRTAYLMGGVVLAAHRGRGLYRALVSARLRHAASRGIRVATTVARAETSAPILTRLSFKTVCALTTYLDG